MDRSAVSINYITLRIAQPAIRRFRSNGAKGALTYCKRGSKGNEVFACFE